MTRPFPSGVRRPVTVRLPIVFRLALLMLWIISYLGCSAEPALDTSLRTRDPCAAPCWGKLMPGESSESVSQTLESSPFVTAGSVKEEIADEGGVAVRVFTWYSRGYGRRKPLRYAPNRLCSRDGKVTRIEIHLDYSLTIEEVVAEYGSPTYTYAYLGIKEGVEYHITLDYPEKGLTFSSYTYPASMHKVSKQVGTGLVPGDLKITTAYYYVPTSIEAAMADAFHYPPDVIPMILRDIQEWPGLEGEVSLASQDRPW